MKKNYKTRDIVYFINEEDRLAFCSGILSLLQDSEIRKKIAQKQAKHKTFTISANVENFDKIGIKPFVKLHFKRVKDSDELDLNIKVDKKENANLSEYFDLEIKL